MIDATTHVLSNKSDLNRFIPKYVQIKAELLAEIRLLNPGDPLTPVAELRKRYNVSQPTIERVIQELRNEGYVESRRGSRIVTTPLAKIRRIGVVCCGDLLHASVPRFSNGLLLCLQTEARPVDMMASYYLHETRPQGQFVMDQLHVDADAGRIDGIIAIGFGSTPHEWGPAVRRLPMASLSSSDAWPHRVVIDYVRILDRGIKALMATGCRRIATFSSECGKPDTEFIQRVFVTHGLEYRHDWHLRWRGYKWLDLTGYREFVRLWNSWTDKPDGLVCLDDNVTSGLVHAACDLGIQLGQTLHVASHANKGMSDFENAPVIRLEIDPQQVARSLLGQMTHLFDHPSSSGDVVTIEPTVVAA